MEKNNLSKNIIYSVLMQTAGVLAPLIISPYISRVFDAGLIGNYGYVLANSSYFVLAEGLGFTLYGTIKVASVRDSKKELSRLFWEITILKVILMIVNISVYCVFVVFFSPNELKKLYWVMLINVIAGGIDITWFLNGIEKFKTNAIRNIIVRTINVILVICLVKQEKDLLLYALIMQLSTLFGNIAVYPSIKTIVSGVRCNRISLIKHIKPSLVYFIPGLINTIFASTDKSILGSLGKNPNEVGLYEQANKVCQLCMSMINAVSNAILPRVAYLYATKENNTKTKDFLILSIRCAMLISMPVSFGIGAISNNFVPMFFGIGYEKSALLLKILCLNVLFVILSNFIAQQCLIARGLQKEYNVAISIGAVCNVVLNVLFVVPLYSVGVSLASVISSFIILVIVLKYTTDLVSIKKLWRISWKYLVGAAVMYVGVFKIDFWESNVMNVGIQVVVGGLLYAITLLLLKDDMIWQGLKRYRKWKIQKEKKI